MFFSVVLIGILHNMLQEISTISADEILLLMHWKGKNMYKRKNMANVNMLTIERALLTSLPYMKRGYAYVHKPLLSCVSQSGVL